MRSSSAPARPRARGRWLPVAGAAALAVVAAGWVLSGTGEIGRAELLREIRAGTAPLILDVRSRWEYEAGHVPGAVRVPFYAVWRARGPERTPDAPVVVYCELGPRAGLARAQLWLSGDPPVRYLEGHMRAWRHDGLPLVAGPEPGSGADL